MNLLYKSIPNPIMLFENKIIFQHIKIFYIISMHDFEKYILRNIINIVKLLYMSSLNTEPAPTYTLADIKTLEAQGIFWNLRGRSILVFDDENMQTGHRRELRDKQAMNFRFELATFPLDRALNLIQQSGVESAAIHIPVLIDDYVPQALKQITWIREICPRLVILEGNPSNWTDIKMYETLRERNFSVVTKFYFTEISAALSVLFSK
jgi:hypothetical protein